MKNYLFIFLIILSFVFSVFCQGSKTQVANHNITELKPSEFTPSAKCPKMPKQIVSYLEQLNCTIPQSYFIKNHHNAFQGEFTRRGQYDWAVLCSRNNTSSILMFWNSQTKNVSEFAKFPNKDFRRAIDGHGGYGYTRTIGKDMLKNLSKTDDKLYGDVFAKIDYWGIDERTPDRKYVIYYIYNNQLLVLENDIRN